MNPSLCSSGLKFGAFGLIAASVSGCALLQASPPPEPFAHPQQFAAATQQAPTAPVVDAWWARFNDPQLSVLIDAAVRDNPSVGQAVAQLDQAGARFGISGADRWPQLNGGLSAARQKQPGVAGTTVSNNFGLSLDIGWEVDLWGRLASQTAAARADFLASAENLRAARQSIAARTARSYFSLIAAEQQAALSRRVVESFVEVARQVGDRVDVGVGAPNDKLLANANLQSSMAGLEQRLEAVKRQKVQLDLLRRLYPDRQIDVAKLLPLLPPPPPAGLPAELLARRPDVVAAELQLHAAGYRLDASRRSLLPRINLSGSIGTASNEVGDLLDGNFGVWSIAGQLLQPIFQGGRLRAQVRLNDALRKQAVEAYADTALKAFGEVETALAVETELRRSEEAFAAAADAAEAAIDVSFNRYRAGIDPLLNVLDSERRALEARSAEIGARLARLQNRIDLHLALGGSFADADSKSRGSFADADSNSRGSFADATLSTPAKDLSR